MNWTFSIKNKITAAAILFLLCVLVLLSNYNDRRHTRKVKDSIRTLYEDRLLAESYLFKLSACIYRLKETLHFSNVEMQTSNTKAMRILVEIQQLNTAYQKTKLTTHEAVTFGQFKAIWLNDTRLQINRIKNEPIVMEQALQLLNQLSSIQLEESQSIVSRAEKEYKTSKYTSDFAMGVVVVLLLVLQALVFAARTFHISNKDFDPNLN